MRKMNIRSSIGSGWDPYLIFEHALEVVERLDRIQACCKNDDSNYFLATLRFARPGAA